MRLFTAELLKIRRRWATYVVLGLLIGLMALVFVLSGLAGRGGGDGSVSSILRFPTAYGIINQFVFGLGSLLAVAFAAAIGGADFNWGVFGVVVARGESRSRYILTKAVAVGIVVYLGVLIAYAAGIALTFVAAAMSGGSAGDPFAPGASQDLVRSLSLGFPVMMERVGIGFAVAVVLRSQIAGIVAGIVLQIGEGIIAAVIIATTFASRFGGFDNGLLPEPIGPEWFQFLPFSIGDGVLAELQGVSGGNGSDLLLRPVPSGTALVVTVIYLAVALAITALRVERAEVTT